MNDRERFHACMHYEARDRAPLYDFSFWEETLPAWRGQGLPGGVRRVNAAGYFGLDRSLGCGPDDPLRVPVNVGLCPAFERTVFEDRGDHELVQQADGVRVLRKKEMGSIPHPESHLLVDRASWTKHYKPRLDPDHPERFDEGFDAWVAHHRRAGRGEALFLNGGSLYGWLRNWMGMERLSLTVYDAPALFEEMVQTLADCICGVLEKVLATGVSFQACGMWEDMCYNAGPLLSPQHFERYLVPRYRQITGLLARHGVDVTWVDCDGLIDPLVPHWLEGGVNCMFPVEVGTWGADPVELRRRFGRGLLMMGGFDKHILQGEKDGIEREVERLGPLVEEGGYIPMPDHRVPPDVPLEHYVHYARVARRVWGRGVNLPPAGWLNE